ncbi:unnamed protein product [Calypogeia fissa]
MAKEHQSGGEGGDDAPRKCAMWMPKKRRFCATPALSNSMFCGNHRTVAGETRIPCPVDPSHTILEENAASHVKKCPATKQVRLSELQSYFSQRVNAGHESEECAIPSDLQDSNATAVDTCFQGDKSKSCAVKRTAIAAMSEHQFEDFVKRIEVAHEACSLGTEEDAFFQPPQCSKWWDPDRDRRLPFQEKHVSQQASLLGNLEAFGLLRAQGKKAEDDNKEKWVYVEFGAGRGYLSHMLCDSYGVSSVVLVERSAYKFKADRTLRQLLGVSVERLKTDIEDLRLQGVGSMQGRHFVAVSKHLCGPATDLTLRCCVNVNVDTGLHSKPGDQQQRLANFADPILEGIGIATCCHHLCQWKSYVNKEFFGKLGFSSVDFDMITWLTSWAVNQRGEHGHAELEFDNNSKKGAQGSVEALESVGQDKPQLSQTMINLDPRERSLLGRKCKDLLDHGRLLWLKQHGLDVKVVNYISSTITPENKLLLARKCYT